MQPKPDLTCKLILLGNGSVGKTSIIARFVEDGFQKVYKQTVGLDFFEKLVTLRGDSRMKLQVWDIGGQSISSKMLGKYIYGSEVVFLCYDVTDPQSFSDVGDWLAMVKRVYTNTVTGKQEKLPKLYLVGNKVDLIHLRKITDSAHQSFVDGNTLDGGFTMSAQSGENVLRVFYEVAASVAGVNLSAYELAFTDRVLRATAQATDDTGRTNLADEIEAEDRAAEEAKRRREERPRSCCRIS